MKLLRVIVATATVMAICQSSSLAEPPTTTKRLGPGALGLGWMMQFAKLRQDCITAKQGLACVTQQCTFEACITALATQPSGIQDPDKDAYYPYCQVYLDPLRDCLTREAASGGGDSNAGGNKTPLRHRIPLGLAGGDEGGTADQPNQSTANSDTNSKAATAVQVGAAPGQGDMAPWRRQTTLAVPETTAASLAREIARPAGARASRRQALAARAPAILPGVCSSM